MNNDEILRTDKKECPQCGSKNVQYQGISGGARAVADSGLPPIDYHSFKCNACGAEFRY